jgi:hypothetical protein
MKMLPAFFLSAILIASSFPALAEDYLGADALLKKAATPATETDSISKIADTVDTAKKLVHDLKAFRETSATLAPVEAATRWFSFADRLAKFSPEDLRDSRGEEGERGLCFQTLIESLPSPATWDALVKAAEARPEGKDAEAVRTHVLRITLLWLTRNATVQEKEMAAQGTESPFCPAGTGRMPEAASGILRQWPGYPRQS